MEKEFMESFLAEVRGIRRYQRRVSAFAIIVLLLVLVAAAYSIGLMNKNMKKSDRGVNEPVGSIEGQITDAIYNMDFEKALGVALEAEKKYPEDYYIKAWLGNIYMRLNDPANAEKMYARSYELYPHEESEIALSAIRKRLAEDDKKKKN